MAESNPMRWVVSAVVASALLAVGLVMFVQSRVDTAKAEAAAAAQASEARVARADQEVSGDLERAGVVVAPFIEEVGAGHFAAAYARLAAPYREVASLAAFTRSCKGSPVLTGARNVRLTRLRSRSSGGAATLEADGTLESPAGAVPVSFVFLPESGGPRILTVSLAGVPVLQGVTTLR